MSLTDLLEEYTSAASIPEEVLDEQGYIRIEDNGSTRLVPKSRVNKAEGTRNKLVPMAKKIFRDFSGYLHSHDREDMSKLLEEAETADPENVLKSLPIDQRGLERVLKRGHALKKRGVPPIFRSQLESTSRYTKEEGSEYTYFPTVDAIFNIFSTMNGRIHPDTSYADPTSTRRIQLFRDYALRNEEVFDLVYQEMLERTDEIYKTNFESERSRKYVLDRVSVALETISEEMKQMPQSQDMSLETYDEEDDPVDIAGRRFWYAKYGEESVDGIIDDYWAEFQDRFVESEAYTIPQFIEEDKDFSNYGLIRKLFGERSPEESDIIRRKRDAQADEIIASQDYSNLVPSFLEEMSDDAREILMMEMQDWIQSHYDRPEELSRGRINLSSDLGLPTTIMAQHGNAIYDRVQANLIEKLDDTEFLEFLRNSQTRRMLVHRPEATSVVKRRISEYVNSHGGPKFGLYDIPNNFHALYRR